MGVFHQTVKVCPGEPEVVPHTLNEPHLRFIALENCIQFGSVQALLEKRGLHIALVHPLQVMEDQWWDLDDSVEERQPLSTTAPAIDWNE